MGEEVLPQGRCRPLTGSAVSEHLAVLRRAALVREEPVGRERHYHLVAGPLAEVDEWLHPFERYWQDRLHSLNDVLDDLEDDG